MADEAARTLEKISIRERAPFYLVGEATGDRKLVFEREGQNKKPFDLQVDHLFGSSPKTILVDTTQQVSYEPVAYDAAKIQEYVRQVLQLEAVACKDWLTNKVDRSVTGKVATQQTCGPIQLPLNNVGVMALDFASNKGVATSIGHAPAASLVDPSAGSRLAIAESLTNILWSPLTHGLKGVSLSANWMWPSKNPGEDSRLYAAVEAVSAFAINLGINIPTGKDSLSMTQKYPDGDVVYAPGTVIISAIAEVKDIRRTVSPVLEPIAGSKVVYIDFSSDNKKLGGSSFAQVLNLLGREVPTVADDSYFARAFDAVQSLIKSNLVLAGHDISEGGMITALLEMCFARPDIGLTLELDSLGDDIVEVFFSENPGVIFQTSDYEQAMRLLSQQGVKAQLLGIVSRERKLTVHHQKSLLSFDIDELRDVWFRTSWLLDSKQRPALHAEKRYLNYKDQELRYEFPSNFSGSFEALGIDPARRQPTGIKAAIIREKGVNGDREMAYALYLAGFDVKDIHVTDLVSGREDLTDVNMIVFVGGFSNSDVLGAAKGWAGAFLYNPKAKQALANFYKRKDTLSLGVCNGCQLMMELGVVYPEWKDHPKMNHNGSEKFESTFVNVSIPSNNSVLLSSLAGSRLGIWVAHGEGRFILPSDKNLFQVAAAFSYAEYPGNPNDSDFAVAALCSKDGRHLAIMPHLERSLFPWNWAYYPVERKSDEISPWIEPFVNAREWIKKHLENVQQKVKG
jgi:phosphoribosylformylglycinamidine synthase